MFLPVEIPIWLASENISAGVKPPEREADYSLPSSAEVKNE